MGSELDYKSSPLDDLYADFEDFDLGKTVEMLKKENKILRSKIQYQETGIEKLQTGMLDMKTKTDTILKNMSALFMTAKAEIERKDNAIADLRREKDNFVFRRYGSNYQNHSSVPQSKKYTNSSEMTNPTSGAQLYNGHNKFEEDCKQSIAILHTNQTSAEGTKSDKYIHSSRRTTAQNTVTNRETNKNVSESLEVTVPSYTKDHNLEIHNNQDSRPSDKHREQEYAYKNLNTHNSYHNHRSSFRNDQESRDGRWRDINIYSRHKDYGRSRDNRREDTHNNFFKRTHHYNSYERREPRSPYRRKSSENVKDPKHYQSKGKKMLKVVSHIESKVAMQDYRPTREMLPKTPKKNNRSDQDPENEQNDEDDERKKKKEKRKEKHKETVRYSDSTGNKNNIFITRQLNNQNSKNNDRKSISSNSESIISDNNAGSSSFPSAINDDNFNFKQLKSPTRVNEKVGNTLGAEKKESKKHKKSRSKLKKSKTDRLSVDDVFGDDSINEDELTKNKMPNEPSFDDSESKLHSIKQHLEEQLRESGGKEEHRNDAMEWKCLKKNSRKIESKEKEKSNVCDIFGDRPVAPPSEDQPGKRKISKDIERGDKENHYKNVMESFQKTPAKRRTDEEIAMLTSIFGEESISEDKDINTAKTLVETIRDSTDLKVVDPKVLTEDSGKKDDETKISDNKIIIVSDVIVTPGKIKNYDGSQKDLNNSPQHTNKKEFTENNARECANSKTPNKSYFSVSKSTSKKCRLLERYASEEMKNEENSRCIRSGGNTDALTNELFSIKTNIQLSTIKVTDSTNEKETKFKPDDINPRKTKFVDEENSEIDINPPKKIKVDFKLVGAEENAIKISPTSSYKGPPKNLRKKHVTDAGQCKRRSERLNSKEKQEMTLEKTKSNYIDNTRSSSKEKRSATDDLTCKTTNDAQEKSFSNVGEVEIKNGELNIEKIDEKQVTHVEPKSDLITLKIEYNNYDDNTEKKTLEAEKRNVSHRAEDVHTPVSPSIQVNGEVPKIRRRITPTPVKDTPICSFKNILEKNSTVKLFSKKYGVETHLGEEGDIPILHLEEITFGGIDEGTQRTFEKSIMKFLDTMNVSNMDCDISKLNDVDSNLLQKESWSFEKTADKVASLSTLAVDKIISSNVSNGRICDGNMDVTPPKQNFPKIVTSTPIIATTSTPKVDTNLVPAVKVTSTAEVVESRSQKTKNNGQISNASSTVISDTNVNINEAVDSQFNKQVPSNSVSTPARFRRRCRMISITQL